MNSCCDQMKYFMTLNCNKHDNIYDCPDVLVSINKNGSCGLIIHDGGTSEISINFCPWCGTKITSSDSTIKRIEAIEAKAMNKLKAQGLLSE